MGATLARLPDMTGVSATHVEIRLEPPMPRPPSPHRDRFDRLYTDNLPLILGYALRRSGDSSDAADVAAEVFLTLWRRLDKVPAGEERLWLFGVAWRVLANHRRGQLRRRDLADRLRTDLLTHELSIRIDGGSTAVKDAMAQLQPRDHEVLMLATWDGLSPTEIAQLEGVPAATVRSRLLRARTRLRELLPEAPAAQPVPVGRSQLRPRTPTDANCEDRSR